MLFTTIIPSEAKILYRFFLLLTKGAKSLALTFFDPEISCESSSMLSSSGDKTSGSLWVAATVLVVPLVYA